MKRIKPVIILVILLVTGTVQAYAQKNADTTSPAVTVLRFNCYSTSDDSIQLKSIVTVKHDDGSTNLANALVTFYSVEKDGDLKIGEAKTDVHGVAIFKIPAHNSYARHDEQMLSLKAMFAGSDKFEASESEFGLKPAKLKLSFYVEDSIRYVKVEGSQLNADGTVSPLTDKSVNISVPKMFSMLKIAEVSLDESGTGFTEFPLDIIGDSLGNLTVVASIEEDDILGNLKGSADISWGLPKHLISPDRPTRELWTPIAPLWMIITLIIMLLGVWGHYVYAVVQLVMIRKSSKAIEKKE